MGARIVVPRLVMDDEIERANALAAVSIPSSYLVGPALAGLLAGLLLTTRLVGRGRPGVAFAAIAVLRNLLLAPLAVPTQLGPALLRFALAGAAWAPYSTVELALLQRLIPTEIGERSSARSSTISPPPPSSASRPSPA